MESQYFIYKTKNKNILFFILAPKKNNRNVFVVCKFYFLFFVFTFAKQKNKKIYIPAMHKTTNILLEWKAATKHILLSTKATVFVFLLFLFVFGTNNEKTNVFFSFYFHFQYYYNIFRTNKTESKVFYSFYFDFEYLLYYI